MLEKWKEKKNPEENQFLLLLASALKTINRNDVADRIENCCHHRNEEILTDLLKKLQDALKGNFKVFMLPRSLWLKKKCFLLETLYVELTMVKREGMDNYNKKNTEGNEVGEQIEKENIFEEIDNKIPRRILIEGQPGYGKTTLVTKFLSDWAKMENYISDRFDLVFVIALRKYEGDISCHLLQQCKRVNGREEEKLRAIEAIEGRVLLLLDGFDETPTKFKEDLYRLFNREVYPQMTVVVTCRTGFFQLETESDKNFETMENKGFEMHFVWDKRVKIQGISPEKRKEFLHKYLNVNDEILRERYSQTNLELNDLYECPLFLLLLAVLMQKKDIRQIRTKTELYKTIFNFVINRSLEKLKGKIEEFDVFDSKPDKFGCREILINFGRLCLEKNKHQSLIFEKNELLKCSGGNDDEDLILKLGFLSKHVSFFNYEEREHVQTIHKSFLEFSVAFYLSSLDEMEREIEELVLKFKILPNEHQLLFPFLGGLLQSNAFKLFNCLSPYKGFISVFNDKWHSTNNVESVLLEIPQTEEILKSLENLSIGSWEWLRSKISLYEWYIGLLKNCQKRCQDISLNIPDHLDIINGLSDDIQLNTINVSVTTKEINIKERHTRCRNLIITIEDEIYEYQQSVMIVKNILSRIKAKRIWLKINFTLEFCNSLRGGSNIKNKDMILNFFKVLLGDEFRHFNFYHLTIDDLPPSLFCVISTYIQELVSKKKIEYGLKINFAAIALSDVFRNKFGSFVELVSRSHLDSILIDHSIVKDPLPFPVACFTTEKHKKFFGLKGLFEGIRVDDLMSCSVEHFYCFDLTFEDENLLPKLLLKFIHLKRLSCDANSISKLGASDSICGWNGFQTVDRLDLNLYSEPDIKPFSKGISLFKNVREVCFITNFTKSNVLIEIISFLPSLKKVSYLYTNSLRDFLIRLVVFKNQPEGSTFGFDELETRCGIDSLFDCSLIYISKFVEKCFLKKIFLKFSIFSIGGVYLDEFLIHFILKENFKVSSQWKEVPEYEPLGHNFPRNTITLNETPKGFSYTISLNDTPKLKQHLSISLDNV